MQHAPHTGYAHLKAHLETWTPRPHPHETAAQERFLRLTEEYLLPELHKLAAVLHDAGMDCTVVQDDTDTAGVGLRIDDLQATIGLSLGDCDATLLAVVSRDGRPNGQIEWFIPYARIHKGLLERELQAAVMRLLTARGTVPAVAHSGPTS